MTSVTPNWASSSQHLLDTDDLPSLPVLQTWVHRPQALAKCTVSDVYQMRTVMYPDAGRYAGRDVFLLNRFPCRMVELVGWVAGVDDKEKSQTVYLDDGDGQNVMCVTIRLSPVARPASAPTPFTSVPVGLAAASSGTAPSSSHFLSAKERKAQRKAAAAAAAAAEEASSSKMRLTKQQQTVYERNDIRVGDIVRVKGRIDEWLRGKEWIRQVAVEPAAGGSIAVVDPDEQYWHLQQVQNLHQALYSRPFQLPATQSQPARSMATIMDDTTMVDSTFSDSLSISIEPSSEMSIDNSQLKLCDPSRLRPSQLTDRTFRQYLLDHVSQETTARIQEIKVNGGAGPEAVRQALRTVFPEYEAAWPVLKSQNKGKGRPTPIASGRTPFGPSSSFHSNAIIEIDMEDIDQDATPRRSQSTFTRSTKPRSGSSSSSVPAIQGFNVASLLRVPHLYHLAGLVVDEQSRKEEKRRRRRIRDGTASQKDHDYTSQRGEHGWRLTDGERTPRMQRLVRWVIRGLSEEGVMVEVAPAGTGTVGRPGELDQTCYLPLPEPLLFPLLIPHIQAEMLRRSKTYLRRSDPRHGHGILLDEIMRAQRRYGEQGRWERVGEWCVEDALVWGEQAGLVKRVGKGWVTDELPTL